MKKIFFGLFAVAATAAAVSGVARAFFTSQAKVEGMTITAGNALLKVGPSGNTVSNWPSGLSFVGLYPGFGYDPDEDCRTFYLKNDSASEIDLGVTGKLTAYTGNPSGSWNILKESLQIKIKDVANTTSTGWRTLSYWNDNDVNVLGDALTKAEVEREMGICLRVLTATGNEISGKGLDNVVFTLTGTQQ